MSEYIDETLWDSLIKTVAMRRNWTDIDAYRKKIKSIEDSQQKIQKQYMEEKEQNPAYELPDEDMKKLKVGAEEQNKLENTIASMNQSLDEIEPIIEEQKQYWRQVDSNKSTNLEMAKLTEELAELTAETQNLNKDEYTSQSQQLNTQIRETQQKLEEGAKHDQVAQKMIETTEKRVIAAEQHVKEHYDQEEAARELQAVKDELEEWNTKSENINEERLSLFEFKDSLRKQLAQTKQIVQKFERMDAIQKQLSNLQGSIKQPNEKEYQDRQTQLVQTWTKLNAEMLEPIKAHIQEGLKDMNLPPLDFTGKDKDNVLFWNERSKSFEPLLNKAVTFLQDDMIGSAIRRELDQPELLHKRLTKEFVRWAGEIQVYPDDHAMEPYRVQMGKEKEQFAVVGPPLEPKEPGVGAKIMDWVASLFGKTNATCDQYRRDMAQYHQTLADWELPQKQQDGLKRVAEKRTEALAVKPISKAERLASIEPIKTEKEPELTPKIRSTPKASTILIKSNIRKER